MRLERLRSASRAQGSHLSVKPKNRQPLARHDLCDSPDEDFVPHHSRGQQFPVCESSYHRHHSRGRTARQFRDEFEMTADRCDPDPSKASKSESDFDHRDSPFSTRGTSDQSYEGAIEEGSPEPEDAYETDNRSKEFNRKHSNKMRKGRLRRSWQTDVDDDAFSCRTGSKSQSSSGSGSSYSSSSDEDFQLNANCMNALFTNDTERASNLIRCDKAGPSATEVQLKMTLPLPIQLMDGLDHLVPTKREFRSAMKSLKIQSDKIAKNCDFDYNRLDEQVIDEEFAGYAMPHFYKSLFEAPTELSSEGEESSSREKPSMNNAFKNSKVSAFISKPVTTRQPSYSHAASSFRPGSLPSQVMIEENSSMFSSHDSLGMQSFGMKKQKRTLLLQCDSVGGSQCNTEGRAGPSGKQLDSLGQAATQRTNASPSEQVLLRQSGNVEQIHPIFFSPQSRGELHRVHQKSSEMIQDNPSFDEGNLPSTISDIRTPKDSPLDRYQNHLKRDKDAIPKVKAACQMNSPATKEWISARKVDLDFVDNLNASFDAPDDEAPKASRDRRHGVSAEHSNKALLSFVEGIPTSVDYGQKTTDKDIRTVCSDLTVDEESFEKDESQVISFSIHGANHTGQLIIPDRSVKTQEPTNHSLVLSRSTMEPKEVESNQIFSGDELMGPPRANIQDFAHVKVGHFANAPSMETEEGPMDEMSRKEGHESSNGIHRAASPASDAFTSSRFVLPFTRQTPSVRNQEQVSSQRFETYGVVSVVQKEATGNQFPGSSDEGEVPMDEQRSGESLMLTQGPLQPPSQVMEEMPIPIHHIQTGGSSEQGVPSKSNAPQFTEERQLTFSDGSPLMAPKRVENLAVKNIVQSNESEAIHVTEDLTSVGFANRLKTAAAARLEAMSTAPLFNSHLTRERTSIGQSCLDESCEIDIPTTGALNITSDVDELPTSQFPTTGALNVTSDVDELATSQFQTTGALNVTSDVDELATSQSQTMVTPSKNAISSDDSVSSKCFSSKSDQHQEEARTVKEAAVNAETLHSLIDGGIDDDCDEFLDTADPDEGVDESGYSAIELGSQEETIRFVSEIDARSHAVEINYIGRNRTVWTDSQSLVTEPQLVIAPTNTTLGTSLASAHTLFTMDTPVREPSTIFDPCDEIESHRSLFQTKASSEGTFRHTDEFHDEDSDYQFDERHARLAALLPDTQLGKAQSRSRTPLNLIKSITIGVGTILLLAISWLMNLLRFQQRKTVQPSKWIEGEPNFRGWVGTKHESPPTRPQRIQGTRSFRSEIQQMDQQEAGIIIEFVVPDVHSRNGAIHNKPIWTLERAQKSRRLQHLDERYVTRRTSFSRNDTKSVASLRGWSSKPVHPIYDPLEES